jgi:hypothetical protein
MGLIDEKKIALKMYGGKFKCVIFLFKLKVP